MNFHRPIFFAGAIRRLGAGIALLFFLTGARAEPAGGGRWLFIFDTSSAMKKMLPATEVALKQFLIISAGGELVAGDSVAVWTVGRQVSGKFPTFTWAPDRAVTSTTNLVAFLEDQSYRGDSKLALLQAPISRVVENSERLTIILFCDGQSDITGTPYDEKINRAFHESRSERKKSRQPFVVILRSQLGKIIGCSVNFPPGGLTVPLFPPPPAPPPPPPPVTNNPAPMSAPPPVAPVASGPDLVIVGTRVGTNFDMLMKTAPVAGKATNEPVKPAVSTTNSIPAQAPATNVMTTNFPAAAIKTNVPAAITTGTPDPPMNIFIRLGVALLAAAGLLVLILLLRNRRRTQASLITSSMSDGPPRRK